ncbi:hypothetical protein BAUCODRAFT_313650 [Baudoinia panamericana UAMH 10762]|uniref:SprT-like domain-containing protein n=1 Tax=Baudoinia panamericana (strain UAMH 10762) TaxID=717646 RepID=M2MWS7_BAUPA|nr:uncharacterized protein BAUCODRAFT_313650 [Baudoinia panamericana UAMH 10762]EMC91059.1 hypothetical protein BAUCODRAFT_313650 [Baudoinia panamericana UAMH 10762]
MFPPYFGGFGPGYGPIHPSLSPFGPPMPNPRQILQGLPTEVLEQMAFSMTAEDRPSTDSRYKRAYADKGTPYPISAQELDILQNPMYGVNLRPLPFPVPMPVACAKLIKRLNAPPSTARCAAAARINSTKGTRITWDLMVKIFNDLDTCVYGGDLHHRVRLDACPLPSSALGVTRNCGIPGIKRIHMSITTNTDWSDVTQHPHAQILGVLIHEMLHAYYFVWCGNQADVGDTTGHGRYFHTAAAEIEKLLNITIRPETALLQVRQSLGMWPPCQGPLMYGQGR